MAGCSADSQTTTEGKMDLEAMKVEAGVVVSLVSESSTVAPGDSVELVFSIENLTEESLRVLPWGTPLEPVLSADLFDVVHDEVTLPYRGRVIKRAPPGDADYLDIAAGDKRVVTVNLSQAYDTRTAGSYQIQLKMVDGEYVMRDHSVKVVTDAVVIERL